MVTTYKGNNMTQTTHAFVRKDLAESLLAIPSMNDDRYFSAEMIDGSIVLNLDDDSGDTKLRLPNGEEVTVQSIDLDFTTTFYGG